MMSYRLFSRNNPFAVSIVRTIVTCPHTHQNDSQSKSWFVYSQRRFSDRVAVARAGSQPFGQPPSLATPSPFPHAPTPNTPSPPQRARRRVQELAFACSSSICVTRSRSFLFASLSLYTCRLASSRSCTRQTRHHVSRRLQSSEVRCYDSP
jgi:hypothetical protein